MSNKTMVTKSSILIIFLLVLFAGCASPEERAKSIEKKEEPKAFTVLIEQMKFVPAEIYANEGDTVNWINKDIVDHNVTEEANNAWSSAPLGPGKSWKMVIHKNADYFCSIHPVMKGKIFLK